MTPVALMFLYVVVGMVAVVIATVPITVWILQTVRNRRNPEGNSTPTPLS
jgi:uncharacterized membrane protein